ncbi:MAG TPA: hypothetical protein VGE72_11970 [Azospirillum sp.]
MSALMEKGRIAALAAMLSFVVSAAMLAGVLAASGSAQARGSVTVGIGIGAVVPFHRPHHHHYYPPPPMILYPPPPPVLYAPPPVVYAPPPPVVYAPVPGIAADPAGPPYATRGGRLCREYRTTIIIEGRPQPAHGTACQMADGSWQVVN